MLKKLLASSNRNQPQQHYLFDVDDTLIKNLDRLVFNENIINHLLKNNVKKIKLLTKMELTRISPSTPLRSELIDYLSKKELKWKRCSLRWN